MLSIKQREKKIIRSMREIWDSLNSHLDPIVYQPKPTKKFSKFLGGKIFDKKCVRKYAKMIKDLADIL